MAPPVMDMAPPPRAAQVVLHRTIAPRPMAVRSVLGDAVDALRRLRMSRDTLGRVELGLAEALNNVVEHALAGCEDGWIDLELRLSGAGIEAQIKDNGTPPDRQPLPPAQPLPPPRSAEELREGGYGWLIITQLCDGMSFRREGQDNILKLRFAAEPVA